tara:strand:- start:668 stop:1450 length:783 start_codon:yes stop_codon:yes gene_type:complete
MIYAKKSLGQNFLKDKNIIKKIVSLLKIKGKHIIEIGPGDGALTNEILNEKPKSLKIIEKDFYLSNKLMEKYCNNKNLKVFNDDILKFNLDKIIKKNTIIFGNLPYNISSQIFIKIIKLKNWEENINGVVFMFQKELGEKIISKFPSINYGRLSILANLKIIIKNKFMVSPNCFFPKPKVTSMVIHFTPSKTNLFKIKNIASLENVTNILFSNKRKMINKNIKKILSEEQISNLKDLTLNSRPSDIKPQLYYKITELFEK